jgi:molybdopterin synthase sulfur carrier subunit
MVTVKIKMYGLFREKTGAEEAELSGEKFIDIMKSLVQKYSVLKNDIFDEDMKLMENVYLINGRNINLIEDVDSQIKDGDNIAIFPIVTGG